MRPYLFIGLLLCVATLTATVSALPPALPMEVSGTVFINGDPAPIGTVVTAHGINVLEGVKNNPITLTKPGSFGGGTWDQKLVIQSGRNMPIPEGSLIVFRVNGIDAEIKCPGTTCVKYAMAYQPGNSIGVELHITVDESAGGGCGTCPGIPPASNISGETTFVQPAPKSSCQIGCGTPNCAPEIIYCNGIPCGIKVWDASTCSWNTYSF